MGRTKTVGHRGSEVWTSTLKILNQIADNTAPQEPVRYILRKTLHVSMVRRPLLVTILSFVLAFSIGGVCASYINQWWWQPLKEPISFRVEIEDSPIPPKPDAHPTQTGEGSAPDPVDHASCGGFDCRVEALELLPGFMGKTGHQTFYLSETLHEADGDYAYAYWKQDNSIIIFHVNLGFQVTEFDLYWLSTKARIDLKKDVVPRELDNMGCCLVTKAWADNILRMCKRGRRVEIR